MLTDRDRGRYHQEASALLARNPWADEDVDYAVRLHDLLEAPDDASPDPIARQLRTRLIKEFDRVLATADNPAYRVRREFFAQSLLDAPDPLRRRLFLLFYRGVSSFTGYQGGAQGELQVAIDAYLQLDRLVQAEGSRAADALGGIYGTALLGLAAACYIRYNSRRELLQMDLSPELEREIRADLDLSIEASERTLELSGNPATRASALSALGSAYAFLYEDDKRYNKRATIKKAISLLREAVQLAEAAVSEDRGAIAAIYNLRGVRDRLAAALAIRDRPQDVDEAISLLLKNQAEAAPHGLGQTAGEAASLATAYLRRYLHTGEDADRQRAYEAYSRAFVIAESEHLPEAFTVAAQWGGLAWKQSRWADAGAAYQRATRVMHLAVRQQGSRADREWVVRKAPGVAARAALGLTRSGAVDEAMVTLETGRAVLLTEIFDRRAVDHQRIESLAGKALADDYQRLTDELTGFEARLLIAGPEGEPAVAAAVEQARRQRSALRSRLPAAARNTLTELDGPPTVAELHRAAGRATVVYLDTTSEGGLALILRPGQAPGEPVELEGLTVKAVVELWATLEFAVSRRDPDACEEVCQQLWRLAMERLLPKLQDAPEVVLIPGGGLAGLPWHAARLPGRAAEYVLDRVAVSYMPNLRSLPLARAAWQHMPPSLRVLAVEAPEPTSAAPIRTADEIAAVQSHSGADFRVIWLPGAEATRPLLRESLSQFEVLHFAGHAFGEPDPLAGGLLLAHDEHLTIRELLASGIGAARFAVLSACETARVEDLMSDEMVSFPTALLQCGFGGVIGSLWATLDRPTTILMKAFYQEWRGNSASPRQALRAAQQRVRSDRRYASPLAWASFVYVGP